MTTVAVRGMSIFLSFLATLGLLTVLAYLIAVEELIPQAKISGLRVSQVRRAGSEQRQSSSSPSRNSESSIPQTPRAKVDLTPRITTSLEVPRFQIGTPKAVGDAQPSLAGLSSDLLGGEGSFGEAVGDGFLPVIEGAELIALRNSPPRYPPAAERRGIEGKITIEMIVTEKGQIADVTVKESTPPGVFDAAALSAVRRWQFRPVIREGKPSRVRAVQTIVFQLKR